MPLERGIDELRLATAAVAATDQRQPDAVSTVVHRVFAEATFLDSMNNNTKLNIKHLKKAMQAAEDSDTSSTPST